MYFSIDNGLLLVGCSGNNEPAAEIDNKTADNTAAEENSDQDQAALKASVEGNVENPYEFMLE